jgi:hypothetical protein
MILNEKYQLVEKLVEYAQANLSLRNEEGLDEEMNDDGWIDIVFRSYDSEPRLSDDSRSKRILEGHSVC